MKTAARNFPRNFPRLAIVGLVMLILPAAGRGADGIPRRLLAHGNKNDYWSADVGPTLDRRTPTTRTVVRTRAEGEPQWRPFGEFSTAAVGLANRGQELLVVLAGGQWAIVSEGGVRSGIPLPGGADVLALAGDADDVWAVGAAPAGKMISPASTSSATTSATTLQSRRSTSPPPATAPALPAHDLGLFLLRRGSWVEQAVLPTGVHRDDVLAVSLAVVDRRLMLAVATKDLTIRVYPRMPQGWADGEDVAILGERGEMRLLDLDGRPALWVADHNGPGSLLIHDQRWGPSIQLQPPKLSAYDAVALSVALGRIRLLASDGKSRLAEQLYNADGTLAGAATESLTVPRGNDEQLTKAVELLVMAVLLAAVLGSMRQRPAMLEAMACIDELRLASLGRRLIGGAIDLLPVVLGLVIAVSAMANSGQPVTERLTYRSPAFAWFAVGIVLYLLHTTLCELAMQRSIGKLITGTRVAALNGGRPDAGAVLLRNLLRIIDLMVFFAPLGFVILFPLRQRVGDMAAGTVVIMNDAPLPPPPESTES